MNRLVIRNAGWLIVCRIIKALLGAVVSVLTARFLGPSNFGLVSYASSITAFFAPIVLLGFNSILVQELIFHREEEGKILGSAIWSTLACSLVGIALTTLSAAVIDPSDGDSIVVCGIFSISLMFQATELIQYWFQAKYQSKTIALVGLLAYVLVSTYKILLLALKVDVYWFALSNAFDYMIISTVLIILYWKGNNQPIRFSKPVFKRLFQSGRYYIVSALMIVVFAQTDKVMIKAMLGNDQNGYYSAAVACASMTITFFSAVIEAMRPYILEGKQKNEAVFEARLKALYMILIWSALFSSLFFCVFSNLIVWLLYGPAYMGASKALRVVIWYTGLSCLGGAKDIWILAEGKQKNLLWLNSSGALLNIILNYYLIQRIGIVGAAISTLITQFFSNFFLCFLVKDLRPNMYLLAEAANPLGLLNTLKRTAVAAKRNAKK